MTNWNKCSCRLVKTFSPLYHQTRELKTLHMTTRQIIVLLIIPFVLLIGTINLNAQGWKREYPEVSVIHHVAQTPDKGFLACGVDKNGRVAILKTDADGAVLSKRVITEIPSVDNVFLTESKDGNFYIAASSNTSSSIEILKISPKTELIWIKSAPIKLSITDFKQFSDGNLGVAGLGESATPKFIKLNSQADTLWTRTYNNPTGYLPDFAE
ncbi:MAG TPA: hypothetical protein V6C58_22580, partial [Allocoleopsis sp.]